MRAIGMTRRRVLLMFLTEALLLGLLGTTIGALGGAATAMLVDAAAVEIPSEIVRALLMSDVLHFSVSPLQVILVVGIFTAITGLSALWPALRAARMQPVTAIQHAD
jgi:putative ABC transport system permease protein